MMNRSEVKRAEASLTWMMYECAEEEGAMLLQSYTETDHQTLPGALDEKCRALIEKDFVRQQSLDADNTYCKDPLHGAGMPARPGGHRYGNGNVCGTHP